MKKQLNIPAFKTLQEEQKFWSRIDLSRYFEPDDFESAIFPNLKPTSQAISIRIPSYLLARVKEQANSLMIPYQSLIKSYIQKGVLMK